MQKISLSLGIMIVSFFMSHIVQSKVLVDTFEHPEAVVSDGKYLYVSNFGPDFESMRKDGDGYIAKIDFNGKVIEAKFISKLDAPKGMAIVNNTLFVTDITAVKGFDLTSGERVFLLEIPHALFLNDIEPKNSRQLFVSDSRNDNILLVDIAAKTSQVFAQGDTPYKTNGMYYSQKNQRLYVVGWGSKENPSFIGFYSADKPTISVLSRRNGSYDGVERLDDNHLLVSDWQDSKTDGVLLKVNMNTGDVLVYDDFEKIAGAADFYLHSDGHSVYIPGLASTKLHLLVLP